MTDYESILSAAQALSPSERAQLIADLWDSASPEDWPLPSDERTAAETHWTQAR